jgi:hypothetical protein
MKSTGAFALGAIDAAAICSVASQPAGALSAEVFGRVGETPSAPHGGSPDCFDSPTETYQPRNQDGTLAFFGK